MAQRPPGRIIGVSSPQAGCRDCHLRERCLPHGLKDHDLEMLDDIIKPYRTIRKGEALYRAGDPLRALYAVRRGMFKTSAVTEDGRVHVTGFFLPSEVLGFDAITSQRHHCTAEALETSDVCEVPFERLEELAHGIRGLQHQILSVMSQEIQEDEQMLIILGRMTAEERLATFLANFSRRQSALGLSAIDLNLVMSRQDIGHFLGLALETVSRLLSRFQEQGVIEIIGRQVRILDPDRIESLAHSGVAAAAERQGT